MRFLAACALCVLSCASRSSSKDPVGNEAGKGTVMTNSPSACTSAAPALRAVLETQDVETFSAAGGAGHDELTKLGAAATTLRAIGLDASCPIRVRLAAFEGWIGLNGEAALGTLDDATADVMAAVQAGAIRGADDGMPWGLPANVTASPLSRHVIVLGRRALPALKPLLDDARELPYSGSETAAVAELRKYRVQDLAAGIVAVIVGQAYDDAPAPAERDRQIASFRGAI
jgi:hypothetical protein